MSHLADSDGENSRNIEYAVGRFDTCIDLVRAAGANPSIVHIAQSAGSIRAHSRYANTVRLGIGLYGINPLPVNHKMYEQLSGLKPALRFTSTITHVIELQKGDKVSYGYTFTAPRNMRIGIVPVGYYEGVNRALSNGGLAKIGERSTPIVGRVCMNHTMISLEGTDAQEGAEVLIYSNDPVDPNAINNLVVQHDLFCYSLLTALNSDVRRLLVE